MLWVTCGRRPGKDFLTVLQHWSGVVTCPACRCGSVAAGPNALRGSDPNRKRALLVCDDPNGLSRSPDRPYLHYVVMPSPIR